MIRLLLIVACVGTLSLPLAACGKKGAPSPPGPDSEIIYPRTYPTH
jgi:predicted small lipoprotein YifL